MNSSRFFRLFLVAAVVTCTRTEVRQRFGPAIAEMTSFGISEAWKLLGVLTPKQYLAKTWGAVFLLLLLLNGSSAQPRYSIVAIPLLDGVSNIANDINDLGYVCGSINYGSLSLSKGFVWKYGQALQTYSGVRTFKRINNNGFVMSQNSVWKDGVAIFHDTTTYGINNLNQIVGSVSVVFEGIEGTSAYKWDAGRIVLLPGLGCSECVPLNVAEAINDSGITVGWSNPFHNVITIPLPWPHDSVAITGVPVLWDGLDLVRIGPYGNRSHVSGAVNGSGDGSTLQAPWPGEGYATDVNNAGTAIGYNITPPRQWAQQWDGTLIDLPFTPIRINDKDPPTIIGNGGTWDAPLQLYWKGGQNHSLNEILPPNSGWTLKKVYGVNNRDEFIGVGTFGNTQRGFLLTPNHLTFYHQLAPYFSQPKNVGSTKNDTIPKVCSDGSTSTVIAFNGPEAALVVFRIAQDASGMDPYQFGSFGAVTPVRQDSAFVLYTHPTYISPDSLVRHLDVEAIDALSGRVLVSSQMEVYRPPVVMVHGLWGHAKAFEKMKETLLGTFWPLELSPPFTDWVYPVEYPNAVYFSFNARVIPGAIKGQLNKLRNVGISAGRVDLIGHSMGGILSRLYIQRSDYTGLVNRLVTINTPHAGSQFANFLLDDRFALGDLVECSWLDIKSGAMFDLQVGSEEIVWYLNGPRRGANPVLSHAIVSSVAEGGLGELYVPLALGAYAAGYFTTVPGPDGNIAIPDIEGFQLDLFNGHQHDGIVPVESQRGGLEEYTHISFQKHTESPENPDIISEVGRLLKLERASTEFAIEPFDPPNPEQIKYHINVPPYQLFRAAGSDSVTITSPQNGDVFASGQTVRIGVAGSTGISNVSILVGNRSIPGEALSIPGASGEVNCVIPVDAIGKVSILAVGFDGTTQFCVDTISISVVAPSLLVRLSTNADSYSVPAGQKIQISVVGYFLDGIVRDLGGQADIAMTSGDKNVAQVTVPGEIQGLVPGITTITLAYGGLTKTIGVDVLESTAWANPPGIPMLTWPHSGSAVPKGLITVQWLPTAYADNYHCQLSISPEFTSTLVDQSGIADTFFVLQNLLADTVYYWRVRASNLGGFGPWSGARSFRTLETAPKTIIVASSGGWNLLSVPVNTSNMHINSLFSSRISPAYRFHDSYVITDTLETGTGYWCKFATPDNLTLSGAPVAMRDIAVQTGWNMIGPFDDCVPIGTIATTPPGMLSSSFFGYSNGYTIVDTLIPGKGYWIKSSSSGILNLSALSKGSYISQGVVESNWLHISMKDHNGSVRDVHLASAQEMTAASELPPLPPAGVFDARYSTNTNVERAGQKKYEIQLVSAIFPVEISASNTNGKSLRLKELVGGQLLNETLKEGKPIILSHKLSKILVEESGELEDLPTQFELSQNYPNPFNPATLIKYALPKTSYVVLSIYNTLGQDVADLVNEYQNPGYYEVKFDATGLSSGVYFYRMQAGSYVETKKLLLVR